MAVALLPEHRLCRSFPLRLQVRGSAKGGWGVLGVDGARSGGMERSLVGWGGVGGWWLAGWLIDWDEM